MDSQDDIFLNAREISDPSERANYLDQACGADHDLRQRVETMLRDAEGAEAFFGPQDGLAHAAGDAQMTEGPGTVIGRYKLLQKIGEGGMGAVYMAEQREPVIRKVALKIIKLGMDTRQVLARFEAERQALALMDHPNIAKILDGSATDTGRPFFVMDLVQGLPITRFCDEAKLSTRERLDLFLEVCSAIQHAHQKGIIHRDIKPANVLVTLHGDKPVPKVIDFGIAKATQGRLTEKTLFTQFQHFIGTPAYMSPEQASLSGLDVDTRSDIYGLGVLLYELLTGKAPFDEQELMKAGIDEMRRTIREREPLRPSTRLSSMAGEELTQTAKHRRIEAPHLISTLRGDLDWIVMKCLEKDRARRYETASGLAADLKRHLTDEPVIARPPSTAYRLQKTLRRNKVLFISAGAVALTLLAGLSISTWSFLRERKAHASEAAERRNAVEQRRKAETGELSTRHLLYVSKMNLAQADWEQNNLGRLRELLEETQNSPDRGFEWYYWQRQTHLALMTLRGHSEAVISVDVSPDGQRIVTGSMDGTAKVWKMETGREMLSLTGHKAPIFAVAFSADGSRIVTGSEDKTARVWDAVNGRELLTLKGHNHNVEIVAFSADGRRILTGSPDQTVRLWDATTGLELLRVAGHPAALSPDGRQIVTSMGFSSTNGDIATLRDAKDGRELLQFQGHRDSILCMAFSRDGQRIVTGSMDNAKVWEAATGKELVTLHGHRVQIDSAAFSWDGKRIVTGSADQTAKVWDSSSGQELFTFKGHSGGVTSVAFSPDDRRIVTGAQDKTVKLWDALGTQEMFTLGGNHPRIWGLAFSPDGQRIVTGSYDDVATVWEASSGKELVSMAGTVVAFSPDGRHILTGREKRVKILDASTGQEKLSFVGHTGNVQWSGFSKDGHRIVTSAFDKTAIVWEASTGKELLRLKGHSAGLMQAVFSPDGQRILTSSLDGTARIWNAASGVELLRFKEHGCPVYGVAFSPDGQRIVSGGDDGTALVWEASTGRVLLSLNGHLLIVMSVDFSPDGQRVLTCGSDGTAKLWETVTGQEVLRFKGHSGAVLTGAFSPDGQRIVTGGYDGTAKVWSSARAEQVAAWQVEEQTAAKTLAAVGRDRKAEQERERLALASDEGRIKRWLLLAPIALKTGQSGAEGLDDEQIKGEGQLRPAAGETGSTGDTELRWRELRLEDYEDYTIDLNAILGRESTQSVAYAACYIRSETEQGGLQMLVGSDDQAKVYLNGKQVHRSVFARPFLADQDTVSDITLKAGLNVLVFKVVNEAFGWQGSIRFTDPHGNPVKGIKVTSTPRY